ncbi:glucose-1-phosphate cytidylyltransferase [Arcobacter ellisii]|uniref:Glucose-1-phosphate cytidylyltransferase n=1 Tax=Arcobacter ellisii TaxID=913109 RepID=A0A347UBQ2_9BACT|nr:glucose-1-phosphate cytidylyltransferase [Arcobacter ellisii]AXX96280.1 glucose-1-phosphate cytidylyltransferase [Arcobacter ellisii]RXI31877.1 glucose-1-phosphate cytidylyltransferase [Arcobacter ellisii]
MKVLILAGGLGTRLSEETELRPKPMVEIGGKPIIWHIMKIYSKYNFNEFVILLGYKGYYIKEYFMNYFLHQSNITLDIQTGKMEILDSSSEPWKITLLDTGINTMTGARIKKAEKFIGNESFMLTYGDGVGDINIEELVKFHKSHAKTITMTSAQPESRFGALNIGKENNVTSFQEKPRGEGGWVNAGFFVCEPKIFNYLTEDDNLIFEQEPLQDLAKDGELFTYKHHGFWKPMDTLRDKHSLQNMWEQNNAPWKVW